MSKTVSRRALLLSALALVLGGATAAQAAPREHPYLFFTKQDVPAIRERLKDPQIARMFERVRAAALNPPQEPRQGIYVMCGGLAYALTGDRAYAEPALRTIDQLVKDPRSWTARGSGLKYCDLNTAIKTEPLAFGYDLLYDAMTEQQREAVRRTLRTKVFANYLEALAIHDTQRGRFTDHAGHSEWWSNCYFNWNAWVNGDIGLAALATLDDMPESAQVLQRARESLRYMHPEFDQGDVEDGGWDEGVMYWGGTMKNATQFYAALEHVLGTDDGFFELPGVAKTMQYGIDFVAPDGHWVSFADCNDRLVLDPPGDLYFLAARYNNPQYMRYLDANSASWHVLPFGVLWRPLVPTPPAAPRPRARLYRDVNWALLTAGPLYVPFKAGDLGANHGQWEDNNLLIWLDGERMLNDPGYGNRETADHNCLLVDGRGQTQQGSRRLGGHTPAVGTILACKVVGDDSYLVSDAASCYAGALKRYQRHVVVSPSGCMVVLDDVEAVRPAQFTVNWHTLLDIGTAAPDTAVIAGESHRLYVAAAADGPLQSGIVRAQFDRAFRVQSAGRTGTWRLLTVFMPGARPAVRVQFDEGTATVNVNGRPYTFRRTDGGYRYAGEGPAAGSP